MFLNRSQILEPLPRLAGECLVLLWGPQPAPQAPSRVPQEGQLRDYCSLSSAAQPPPEAKPFRISQLGIMQQVLQD